MNDTINIKELRISGKRLQLLSKVRAPGSRWHLLSADINFRKGLPDKIKESFYVELSSMLKAGVDIRSALELLQEEYKRKEHKLLFNSILSQVLAGATFSAALRHSGQFSAYEYSMVEIGEETGRLSDILKQLSIFFQHKVKQRRQIIGALTYPILVLVVAFAAIFFMVSYVVPMFADIFKRSGDDLPRLTQFVLALSHFTKNHASFILLFLVGVSLFFYWQRRKGWLRRHSSNILITIPVWGSLVHKIYLGQYCHVMSLLLSSRISIVHAIELSGRIITFYPFQACLKKVEYDITSGCSLFGALKKHKLFPPKFVAMIRVGEEVNQLDFFFRQLAEQHTNEIEHQTQMLSKFIEPLTIIILGLIVGIILIAMYLPLFQLGQQF